jgi:PAS domain-containing protein
LDHPDHFKKLFAAGAHATSLGIALLDSQTRFEVVNASLARETRAPSDRHIGKTSSQVVGDLARQIEPTYERVLRTGKPSSVLLEGHVRDTPESGYWLDHCFPIFDGSGRVEHLGLFVVNVTAEKASREILNSLATDSKLLRARDAGILEKLDESIRYYHWALRRSFEELAAPLTEPARKADGFHSSIQQLDDEISEMRDLVYTFISQFSIPGC